jgi:hypothetical protein
LKNSIIIVHVITTQENGAANHKKVFFSFNPTLSLPCTMLVGHTHRVHCSVENHQDTMVTVVHNARTKCSRKEYNFLDAQSERENVFTPISFTFLSFPHLA